MTHTKLFISVLFTVADDWKQTIFLSNSRMKKIYCIFIQWT